MANKLSVKTLLNYLINLEKNISKFPPLLPEEMALIEAENAFESVYFSTKLEGNKLSEEEAKNAILADCL